MKPTFKIKWSGLLFNVVMGVILAHLIGVAPVYGALSGIAVPMALGKYMPEGCAFEGVYTEIWTGELVKRMKTGLEATWLDGIPDYSAKVKPGEVIHLVDVGMEPDVLINNTTYPIPVQDLKEGDIPLGLDKYQTEATRVTDDQLDAISYNKISTDIEAHGDAITGIKFKKAAHAMAPYNDTKKTPVVPTSGTADANGRKKLVRLDIINLKRRLDAAGVPAGGRRLVLCSDHVNDLLELDQKFSEQYYNYKTGRITNMYGFDVYEYEENPVFGKDGVKKTFASAPADGEYQASFAFYTKRSFKANGSTKMYYQRAENSPTTQESLVNFRHYFMVMPKKMEGIGAIYSWDGTTAQTKGQEAPTAKFWHDARKEAADAAEAKKTEEKTVDPNGELEE